MQSVTIIHKGPAFEFEVVNESGYGYQSGIDYGIRPMQSLLAALGSCSAIDIVTILQKKRILFGDLRIEVSGQRETNVTPSLWKQVRMTVQLRSASPRDMIEPAIRLSVDKYCSVAETLRRAGATIEWELQII